MQYKEIGKKELEKLLETQYKEYNQFKNLGLSYDMARGKPCTEQLDLSNEMLDTKYIKGYKTISNQEVRNYGILDGIPEAKMLMADLMGVETSQVIVCGNSTLNVMYDMFMRFFLFGVGEGEKPWCKNDRIKFICPVPGYDRHFLITEKLGIEMINVDLQGDGPDLNRIEALVRDPLVKGMWMVPKYSNPTGEVYSDAKIRRLAKMKTGASDFRIFCDDAYTVHFLKDKPAKQLNILEACVEAGNPNRAFLFGSTSKITLPGAGISCICASPENIKYALSLMTVQTISYDKINQLRHARFLKDYDGILAHMAKHAEIIRPKFAAVDRILTEQLQGLGILEWNKPTGGYFISVNTLDGCASKIVKMAADAGLKLTPAGSTYPYHKDPRDRNIRIAPTFPPIEELEAAIRIFCCCVRIVSIEKILETKE